MTKEHVTAFSDGVFAVAITLRVLDIRVPSEAGINSNTQLVAAVSRLAPA